MRAPSTVPSGNSPNLGSGSVRAGFILPLTAEGEAGAAALSLRNAADLALSEFENADLRLLVKDDRGSPEGAREAAQQAIEEGAELIIGPLFAPAVQAAAGAAKPAGKPVIAFSTDVRVASPGVYLLSFLPQSEVERIIAYAAAQGRRGIAALIAETPYGSAAEAALQQSAATHGANVVAIERYAGADVAGPAGRIAALGGGNAPRADALFIPDGAEALNAIAPAFESVDLDRAKVKFLGTGIWNDPRVFRLPALEGGWFAAPDSAGFEGFAGRYRARFQADPTRIATLAYDAVSLAVALIRTQGPRRFSDAALTNPVGFNGADGVFRFRRDGTNDRALNVLEIRQGAAVVVSPAPRTLSSPRG